MGFGDFLKEISGNMTEEEKQELQKKKAEITKFKEDQKDYAKTSLNIKSGQKSVNAGTYAIMYQRTDGSVYFNKNYYDRFALIDYTWDGPMYEIKTTTVSSKKGKEKKKGKSGKMTAGAVIGTMLMPGVGTAVGAAIGAGGKGKKKYEEDGTVDTTQQQVEVMSKAVIKLKNLDSGEFASIAINCNSDIDAQIKCFQFSNKFQTTENAEDIQNIASALKSLKELVDLGLLTQEEFEKKKGQLLN